VIVLLDADALVYRIGFAYEHEDKALALWQLDNTIDRILEEVGSTTYEAFLTSNDRSNFRFQIDRDYKGNRVAAKPKWYDVLRLHLVQRHKAVTISGMEADDAIAIRYTELHGPSIMGRPEPSPEVVINKEVLKEYNAPAIIVASDKDFLQVQGWHYRFVKRQFLYHSKTQALVAFWTQTLVGDVADNIQGIRGIGPKKAAIILGRIREDVCFYTKVREVYVNTYGERGDEELQKAADLLYLRRTINDRWVPPIAVDVGAESPSLDTNQG
jgi:5'-3' exonuclease